MSFRGSIRVLVRRLKALGAWLRKNDRIPSDAYEETWGKQRITYYSKVGDRSNF